MPKRAQESERSARASSAARYCCLILVCSGSGRFVSFPVVLCSLCPEWAFLPFHEFFYHGFMLSKGSKGPFVLCFCYK